MGLSHIITKRLTSDCLIYEYKRYLQISIIIHVTDTWRKAIMTGCLLDLCSSI